MRRVTPESLTQCSEMGQTSDREACFVAQLQYVQGAHNVWQHEYPPLVKLRFLEHRAYIVFAKYIHV